jgi:hypothetical protein
MGACHVVVDAASRGLCGLVCASRTTAALVKWRFCERGRGGGEQVECERERTFGVRPTPQPKPILRLTLSAAPWPPRVRLLGPVRNTVLLRQGAPVFPGSSRLGIEHKQSNSRVAGARPNHQPNRRQGSGAEGHGGVRVTVFIISRTYYKAVCGGGKRDSELLEGHVL